MHVLTTAPHPHRCARRPLPSPPLPRAPPRALPRPPPRALPRALPQALSNERNRWRVHRRVDLARSPRSCRIVLSPLRQHTPPVPRPWRRLVHQGRPRRRLVHPGRPRRRLVHPGRPLCSPRCSSVPVAAVRRRRRRVRPRRRRRSRRRWGYVPPLGAPTIHRPHRRRPPPLLPPLRRPSSWVLATALSPHGASPMGAPW